MNLQLYKDHLATVLSTIREQMIACEIEQLIILAGQNTTYFADDQEPPFHPYPYFLWCVPEEHCEHSAVVISQDQDPELYWFAAEDYWYLPSQPPDYCSELFTVHSFSYNTLLEKKLISILDSSNQAEVIGPLTHAFGDHVNSEKRRRLTARLDFQRAYKTDFELDCMRSATKRATQGHLAAQTAFHEGASELEIHHSYLRASGQNEGGLPYPNIVAINEHAATLHYQRYDEIAPKDHRTLLIDAGGKAACYHSDVTRTYVTDSNSDFHALVERLNLAQQELIETIRPGIEFEDLHQRMALEIAKLLKEFKIVNCSAESADEQHLVDTFFPHGLGHLLGLQTHDVGGLTRSGDGSTIEVHPRFEMLRNRRILEPRMVTTIEPGIYFIPMLLKKQAGNREINWKRVEELVEFGGVRIEDNVVVQNEGVVNLTREEFSRSMSDGSSSFAT